MTIGEHTAIFHGTGHPPVEITIYADELTRFSQDTLIVVEPPEKAEEEGEAAIQMLEGCNYEYRLNTAAHRLTLTNEVPGIIKESRIRNDVTCGRICPGLYIGTLDLTLTNAKGDILSHLPVEVRSLKLRYRNDYRDMIEYITNHCMGLLLQIRSPASARLLPDPGDSAETIAQRFAFLYSLIGSRAFRDAITRITALPHHRVERHAQRIPISSRFKVTKLTIRQFAKESRRIDLPETHYLRKIRYLNTVPEFMTIHTGRRVIDTPENRFVKFALQSFERFLNAMKQRLQLIGERDDSPLNRQLRVMLRNLQIILCHSFFREISEPHMLPLGSSVLQRKGGYRELLRAWLHFGAAARLCWSGGDDVFQAGKRDVAVLYEYWVFFKFIELVSDIFSFTKPPLESMITSTKDGFGLKLKAGRHLALRGQFNRPGRPLNIRLSYNRTFRRHRIKGKSNYPADGSWTERMRPDITLTLWPKGFKEAEAESQELIVHIHFDAKYRVENIEELFGMTDDEIGVRDLADELTAEKRQEQAGTYKRADLLKMHAYRDAIRRTAGAYVIYPGLQNREWRGFHEIIPGLGAFSLRPTSSDDDGSRELKDFLLAVAEHVCDRATQRERFSYHGYRIHENQSIYEVKNYLPEKDYETHKRHAPPNDTNILIGWCKDERHYKWIITQGLYNFRIGTKRGSIRLDPDIVNAKYLLLHSQSNIVYDGLLRIKSSGPRIFSKNDLLRLSYPQNPTADFYFIFDIEPASEFNRYSWDYNLLPDRQKGRLSSFPFSITLDMLMTIAIERS